MGPTHMAANVTTVDCHKQVRSWRLLRAVMELLIPTCNCSFIQHHPHNKPTPHSPPPPPSSSSSRSSYSSTTSSSTFLTGTIYGYKKGKVKFGIQSNTSSILLIELAVPTTILAREMRDGVLRIALESISNNNNNNNNNNTNNNNYNNNNSSSSSSLLEMPVWKMYCNGRRVGFAVKRKPCKADMDFFRKVKNVVVGAGIVKGKEIGCNNDDDIMYLRGTFETFRGSSHAQSFHLIDPDGNVNQDLSIFFLRSL